MTNNTIILNSQAVEPVVIGDGHEQIQEFKKLEQYARGTKWTFHEGKLPDKRHGDTMDALYAVNPKCEIISMFTDLPFSPRYMSAVKNIRSGEIKTYRGTIARYMWELMQGIKENQK